MDRKAHWEAVYGKKKSTQVSWYRPEPEVSLRLITQHAPPPAASVVDVGGGTSNLVDRLVELEYRDITVLDLSGAALHESRARFGDRSSRVNWIEGDILNIELPEATYDVWHDRAVFHFLTNPDDRQRYVEQVLRSVRVGGHVLVATFGADGPEKCSGLPVARYSPSELHAQFGGAFRLVQSVGEKHITPMGTTQNFVYCVCSVEGGTAAAQAAATH